MLSFQDILNHINELLYEIVDAKGKIIYPIEKEKSNRIENIINKKNQDNISYDREDDKWYHYYVNTITKDNKTFWLKYLLDITDIKKDEQKYQMDELTSVFTRTKILSTIETELIECQEYNIPFSLVIADIDYFKKINDTYGHIAGDKVLEKIGSIFIKATNNNNNFVGRYGGEEFIFFFKNTTIKDTLNTINEIKKEIDQIKIHYKNTVITDITISFGIYHSNGSIHQNVQNDDATLSEYIYKADEALYASKNNGRNQTHIYNEDNTIELLIDKKLSNG